ncbi:XRE family transcriptional regulator [Methylobacterium sp. J-070]|uniref:helix-turn-helix domain-containing protein n=1 Tax=Methylobacterium sp. J-070 TaxID=2836650 RepID=UPI001FB9B877|nr:helix-turn-helix domain-containing protein [Methylobacterium sp. J-070]
MGNSLRALRTKRGWTHDQAAAEMGVSRGQFIKLERGERGLTERTIGLAAKAFGVSRAVVMDEEVAADAPRSSSDAPATSSIRPSDGGAGPDLTKLKGPRDVPVLGTGVCGDDGDFRFNGQTIDYAPRPPGIEGKKDVFVVYVVGDSMAERYEDGDPLYVDPHRRPKPRDIVIVELKAPREGEPGGAFVKRLVRRSGGKIVVEQFNPPKELVFDEDDVVRLHRVIPWTELIGI